MAAAARPAGPADRCSSASRAPDLGHRGDPGRHAECGQDPRADRHRRGRLDDPQHVVEAVRPTEVVDQEVRRAAERDESTDPPGAPHGRPARARAALAEQRRGPGDAAEEQVGGDVEGPWGRLDDGPPVVGGELRLGYHRVRVTTPAPAPSVAAAPAAGISPPVGVPPACASGRLLLPAGGHPGAGACRVAELTRVDQSFAATPRGTGGPGHPLPRVLAPAGPTRLDGVAGLPGDVGPSFVGTVRVTGAAVGPPGRSVAHRRRPAKAATTPASRPSAASPIDRYMAGSSAVHTCGSGGSPYTSGSSSSRKNAPAPPTPSPGDSP